MLRWYDDPDVEVSHLDAVRLDFDEGGVVILSLGEFTAEGNCKSIDAVSVFFNESSAQQCGSLFAESGPLAD